MRKYIVLFFSVLLLFAACNKGPQGILTPTQMTNILIDIHIADGEMAQIPATPDSIYKYGMARYLGVFKTHHVDSAQFNQSFKYYTKQPKQLVAIYDSVINRLTKKTDSINAVIMKNNIAKQKKDAAAHHATPVQHLPPPGVAKPLTPEEVNRQTQEAIRKREKLQKDIKAGHVVPQK